MAPADRSLKKEFGLASFSPSASDSGSSGAAYPASGNFTSCKDKKEEGGRQRGKEGGRREEGEGRSAAGRH